MAKIINNEKGFMILEASNADVLERLGHLGKTDACDKCTKSSDTYYYVPLMDEWMCRDCYKKWYEESSRNEEDLYVETRNFNNMKRIFNL